MTGTAFVAPSGHLPPCFAAGETGLFVFDAAADSRWSVPPSFPDARDDDRPAHAPAAARSLRADVSRRLRLGLRGAGVPAENGSAVRYGWGGGLGTLWYSWPDYGGAAVLLTQVLPPSEELITTFVHGAERVLTS